MTVCPHCKRYFSGQTYSKPESALKLHLQNCPASRRKAARP